MSTAIESASRKVLRAMEHRKSVETCIAEYTSRKPYEIISQPDGKKTLKITEQPPSEISLYAGEIIYQLRSALDHLFFDLVERNNAPLSARDIHNCQFPLRTVRPVACGPLGRDDLLPDGIGIPDMPFAFIESLQPYNRWHEAPNLLRLLSKLSNIDKHRRLNAIIARIDRKHTLLHAKGYRSTVITPFLDHGAELSEPWHPSIPDDGTVQVKTEYIPVIAFDESEFGPPQTALIEDVIYGLPSLVFQITTMFKQFL